MFLLSPCFSSSSSGLLGHFSGTVVWRSRPVCDILMRKDQMDLVQAFLLQGVLKQHQRNYGEAQCLSSSVSCFQLTGLGLTFRAGQGQFSFSYLQ
ncbi:hypothetical protein TNCV_2040481 [Trichonephila clavipes]|nr:hypothetical protein TNCV_2040481 [Trichonephila clavipes]